MGARLVHLSVSTSIMVTHKGRKGLAHDLKVWDHDLCGLGLCQSNTTWWPRVVE